MEKATEFYKQALAIAQEIGDRYQEGIWKGILGVSYGEQGQLAQGRQYLIQAKAIYEQIKLPYASWAADQLAALDGEGDAGKDGIT